jgi:AcrR family transcriptional regulator/DNA-binding MarR family transcriptional regulator
MCEQGAGGATVSQIVARAGVSRRTFYDIFSDSEDCVVAAVADALERARARVLPVWRTGGEWRARVRASVIELLVRFDEDPVLARLLVVESLGAGEQVLELRARVLDALAGAIEQGEKGVGTGTKQGRLSAEGALGGVLAILHARLTQREPGRLVELSGALMSVLVLPYFGRAAAQRELARALPELPSSSAVDAEGSFRQDPFKGAGMRLTYRTMRVLSVIAEHPGSSNRRVGDLSEVGDQGQISKLLARLERLGLAANDGEGQSRGAPNAWSLTAAGQQVMNTIQPHA